MRYHWQTVKDPLPFNLNGRYELDLLHWVGGMPSVGALSERADRNGERLESVNCWLERGGRVSMFKEVDLIEREIAAIDDFTENYELINEWGIL